MSDTETHEFIIEDDALAASTFTSADGPRFTCEVCDAPLTYSGRGRHPKYCDEHKPGSTSKPSVAKRAPKGVAHIRSGMEQLYELAGDGFELLGRYTEDELLTVDGHLIKSRAPVLAEQWAELAERDPEVRKALSNMTTGSSWGGVIVTHVMLAAAIMMNHKKNGPSKAERQAAKDAKARAKDNVRPMRAPTPQRSAPQPQPTQRMEPSPQVEDAEPYIVGVNAPDALFVTEVTK
jgi:hypothetical protein